MKIVNWKLKIKRKIIIIGMAGVAALAVFGTVGALNGWFGGGGKIPSDTMTRGLVGYWNFDEGSGATSTDISGNENHGTLTAGPVWASGKVNSDLSFDGTDDYVDAGNAASLQLTTIVSVEAWIKGDAFLVNDHKSVVGKSTAFTTNGYGISIYNSGARFYAGVGDVAVGTSVLSTGQWYHLVGTYDNSNIKIYVNGVLEGTAAQTAGITDAATNFKIGNVYAGVNYFDGDIDEVRVYNRALSVAEVRYHYNRGAPVAYWKLDEGASSTAYDASGNGNTGVLTGGPTWTSGKYGSALSFDGVDDYVDVSNTTTTSQTISFWLNRQDTADRDVIDLGTPEIKIASNAITSTGLTSPTYYVDGVKGATALKTNQWQHISITDTVGATISPDLIDIGKASASYFNGLIDDVRIYNYARTPEEIRLDYNAGMAALFGPSAGSGQALCDIDPGSCMTKGLAGQWSFDEGTGATATDISGNDNNGTLTSGPSWVSGAPCLAGAKCGGGLSFDGSNDYADVADSASLNITGALTIEAWANVPTWSWPHAFVDGNILDKGASSYSVGYGLLGEDTSADFCFIFYSGGVSKSACSAAQSANTWLHLVGTYDGSVLKMYVNGQISGTPLVFSGAIDSSAARNLNIGTESAGGSRAFAGLIDEVRIYNRALSEAEIRYHYNRGGPVAYWKFDEGASSTAYDASGQGNTGVISGASWTSGKYGSALSFDGVDDYVDVSNTTTTSQTISFWLNRQDTADRDVIDLGTPEIKIASNAITSTGLTSPTYYVDGVKGAAALKTNQWQHISITDTVGATISPDLIDIGKASASYFNGLIDDVRIYNYARSADEIRLDYNGGMAARFGPQTDCDRDPGSCMTKGLAGYWNFDEGTGATSTDISGNSNDGTLTSGPAWTNSSPSTGSGRNLGTSLNFDGTNDYVNVGNAASLNIQSGFTIEWWSNKTGSHPVNVPRVISKEDEYEIHLGNTDPDFQTYRLRIWNTLGASFDVSDTSSASNQWLHHVVTVDNSNVMRKYNNGALVNTNSAFTGTLFTNTSNLIIGSQSATNRYFTGLIDEVRVYNRALSEAEIRYHYNRGGPVAYWKFDEGASSTAYDASGNGNTGVLTGGPTWTSGKYGSALSFDGVDDYVDVSNTTTTSQTISFWLNRQDTADRDVIDLGTPEIKIASNAITSTGLTSPIYYVDGVKGATALKTNQWQHISITDTVGATISPDLIDIGKASASYFNGLIDDVRIYNYARTPEQILQDYNGGKSIYFR